MSDSAISPSGEVLISHRYSIRKKLGAGSIGTVYLAQDLMRDRSVAVKLLRPERLEPDGLERDRLESSLSRKALVLVVLAHGCPQHRRELARRAESLNLLGLFPYQFLKSEIAELQR